MAAAADPAARIKQHMNKDHHDSVVRYLEALCGVSSFFAQFANLTEITLSHMTITSLGSTYRVPFDPPLKEWSEARARVVALDQKCIAALDRDPVTLKKFLPPRRPLELSLFVGTMVAFVLLGRRENLQTGPNSYYRPLMDRYPDAAAWLWKIQPWVLYPMLAAHLGEAYWMHRTRLVKHSVPLFSPLWLQNVTQTFCEGFTTFMRVDRFVEEEKSKRTH